MSMGTLLLIRKCLMVLLLAIIVLGPLMLSSCQKLKPLAEAVEGGAGDAIDQTVSIVALKIRKEIGRISGLLTSIVHRKNNKYGRNNCSEN